MLHNPSGAKATVSKTLVKYMLRDAQDKAIQAKWAPIRDKKDRNFDSLITAEPGGGSRAGPAELAEPEPATPAGLVAPADERRGSRPAP